MKELHKKKCIPCEKEGKAMTKEEAMPYLIELGDWEINDAHTVISKKIEFKDFLEAINFVDTVADIAEEEGHHPDIHISYNKVTFKIWTHKVGGLTENDFIIASKIDSLEARNKQH